MGETNKPVKPNRPGLWQRAGVLFSGARLVLVLLGFILDCADD
jgi:hypothetical protein